MPVYKTGPDCSLEDLVASIESKGEKIIQVIARQGRDTFLVISELPVNDTGRPHLPSWALEERPA